jgi:hypothetical protein
VSIECRDRRRKQGVEWVEQMRGKHDRLPTNVLVLVSSSGFTRTALGARGKLWHKGDYTTRCNTRIRRANRE